MTLIELTVSMVIFALFVSIFLAAVTALATGTTQVKVRAESTSGVLIVFQNIDRSVRSADSINHAGVGPSGSRYIEYRIPADSSLAGVTTCVQWRFDPSEHTIATRTWADEANPDLGGWSVRLTDAIDEGGDDYPFSLVRASLNGSARQGLALTLRAGERDVADAALSSTYYARNSSISSPGNLAESTETPCRPTGGRP